jgi:hypothetical protein
MVADLQIDEFEGAPEPPPDDTSAQPTTPELDEESP